MTWPTVSSLPWFLLVAPASAEPDAVTAWARLYERLDVQVQSDVAELDDRLDRKDFRESMDLPAPPPPPPPEPSGIESSGGAEGSGRRTYGATLKRAEAFLVRNLSEVQVTVTSAPRRCLGVEWSLYYGGGDVGSTGSTSVTRAWKQVRYEITCTCEGGREQTITPNFRVDRDPAFHCPE